MLSWLGRSGEPHPRSAGEDDLELELLLALLVGRSVERLAAQPGYDGAFARALGKASQRRSLRRRATSEELRRAALLADVSEPAEMIRLLDAEPWACSFAMWCAVRDRAAAQGQAASPAAEIAARSALAVAERLDGAKYSPALIRDCRGKSWLLLAGVQARAQSRDCAAASFRRAAEEIEGGTGDPTLTAKLDLEWGRFCLDQGDAESALAHFDEAFALLAAAGEAAGQGEALLARAEALAALDRVGEARRSAALGLLTFEPGSGSRRQDNGEDLLIRLLCEA